MPDIINTENIRSFLAELSYPLFFLDFETIYPAEPLFDGVRPYQQIPFMYSLHWIEKEGGDLHHTVFFSYPGRDPRRFIAEELCTDIPKGVCTVAYNMCFEKARVRELSELYPDLADHLMDIHDNMKDLMVPFRRKWYYTDAMEGSYSLKAVLPALYPDDPELDYSLLDGIHNGYEASETYLAMWQNPDDRTPERCRQLSEYCGLDTYALVKLWEKLRNVSSTNEIDDRMNTEEKNEV